MTIREELPETGVRITFRSRAASEYLWRPAELFPGTPRLIPYRARTQLAFSGQGEGRSTERGASALLSFCVCTNFGTNKIFLDTPCFMRTFQAYIHF
jgi:hypothetical protein